VDGSEIMTVEGLADSPERLHPIQQAFWEAHGLQCGFCTPGFLIQTLALLRENPRPSEAEIRAGLSGNLCRCTGYQNIVTAVQLAAQRMGGDAETGPATAPGSAGVSPAPADAAPARGKHVEGDAAVGRPPSATTGPGPSRVVEGGAAGSGAGA
jgi:hypothetical protein